MKKQMLIVGAVGAGVTAVLAPLMKKRLFVRKEEANRSLQKRAAAAAHELLSAITEQGLEPFELELLYGGPAMYHGEPVFFGSVDGKTVLQVNGMPVLMDYDGQQAVPTFEILKPGTGEVLMRVG